MKPTLNLVLRVLCLLVYALALASLAGLLPDGLFGRAPLVAGVLLAIHALETVVMFKHVRLYPGPLAVSIVLTLLYGLLHWKPLADQQSRALGRR
jgi:hypothetical protein